ncbi:hypothetical protein RJT34_24055 [Clitoria ternatea]|uniref:dihydroneopterin aldolase n=1 Tax=Clitoria ternatea TaxID=43366 RepID=A0AAN9FMD1_CLITE
MEADSLICGDKLILRGLSFHGFHGARPEERKLGQKFVIDVDAWMDLRELVNLITYQTHIAKDVIEGSPYNLLESVAHKIAMTTLKTHQQISAIRVKVGKPHVAVRGPVDYLGVEILRHRSDLKD